MPRNPDGPIGKPGSNVDDRDGGIMLDLTPDVELFVYGTGNIQTVLAGLKQHLQAAAAQVEMTLQPNPQPTVIAVWRKPGSAADRARLVSRLHDPLPPPMGQAMNNGLRLVVPDLAFQRAISEQWVGMPKHMPGAAHTTVSLQSVSTGMSAPNTVSFRIDGVDVVPFTALIDCALHVSGGSVVATPNVQVSGLGPLDGQIASQIQSRGQALTNSVAALFARSFLDNGDGVSLTYTDIQIMPDVGIVARALWSVTLAAPSVDVRKPSQGPDGIYTAVVNHFPEANVLFSWQVSPHQKGKQGSTHIDAPNQASTHITFDFNDEDVYTVQVTASAPKGTNAHAQFKVINPVAR